MSGIGLGHDRRYPGLLGASAISGAGDGLVLVALPLLATSISRDPAIVAAVMAAQRLPWVLLSLHGGALVDRLPLRRLLPAVEAVRAVALVALAGVVVADAVQLAHIYAAAFVIGAGDVLVGIGIHTAVPDMVDDRHLDKANGRLELTQVAGDQFLGPAIGGLLFATAAWLPFGIDGLSFAVAAILLYRVLPATAAAPAEGRRIGADVAEGVRWFVASDQLRTLALVISAFAALQAGVMALLVLLATGQLGLAEEQYGLVLAVGAAGNLIGGAAAERLPRWGVDRIVLGAGTAAGIAYVVMGLTGSAIVASAALLVEGIALLIANIVTTTLRQRLIPRELLGRVGAVFRLCIFATMPLGAIGAGLLARATSVGAATWIAGVVQLVVVVLAARPLARITATAATAEPIAPTAPADVDAVGEPGPDAAAGEQVEDVRG